MYNLKKKPFILISFLTAFMLFLAGCGQTADPVGSEDEEQNPEEVSELTLEEVFEKSAAASEELKSFSVDMNLVQDISLGEESMETNSDISMDVTAEPLAFYQKMTMSLAGESMETESYFTEDGIFIYDTASAQWMKFPQEMSDQLLQLSDQQTNPGAELNNLQEFADDFTFEQDDQNYILTLDASGDKFNDFIKETAMENLPPELAAGAGEDAFEGLNINSVQYEILVDKETFYPNVLNMTMDMEMGVEGDTVNVIQTVNGEYTDFNNIESITVPQEVLDSAVDMEM
ncbi:hypothetical protein F7732_22220 [Bacillus mesophilum]|uniref:Uncharacterized protein n=1 Tax=Bacillus mesophilum TaxID=1071718 RepID=A0A7V7USW7_9BACI|nr:DUF6612 family protein [Bacillus mesophilum]KAB2329039.1 hypothetical protein F7732_22220 [Bacillus mesophilum]